MLKSYDYLNIPKRYPGDQMIIRYFNTSMIQIDENNYLYLIRYGYTFDEPIIPGNSDLCDTKLSSRGDNYFWWNEWDNMGGTLITKYNYITKEFINITVEIHNFNHRKDQYKKIDTITDMRICKINGIIYIYTSDLSKFIECIYDNHTNILTLLKYSYLDSGSSGHNFAPFDIININEKLNLLYLDWYYGDHVLIKQYEQYKNLKDDNYNYHFLKNIRINFNRSTYGFFGEGSYETNKAEDIDKYKSFYGITPGFSFTTPHIEIIENDKRCWIGVGHIKIKNPSEKYPYIHGSKIDRFRHNLHSQMFEKYGDKYKLHMGTGKVPNCFGYIYSMYFYKLIDNGNDDYDIFISDSFLPLNLDEEYNDNYKFSLIFPMGIVKQNIDGIEVIKVSCGEGDYYSIILDFDFLDVMASINKNIKIFNIEKYEYYLLLYKNGMSLSTNFEITLSETELILDEEIKRSKSFGGSTFNKKLKSDNYKKYLKYKSKYLKLKNNV